MTTSLLSFVGVMLLMPTMQSISGFKFPLPPSSPKLSPLTRRASTLPRSPPQEYGGVVGRKAYEEGQTMSEEEDYGDFDPSPMMNPGNQASPIPHLEPSSSSPTSARASSSKET